MKAVFSRRFRADLLDQEAKYAAISDRLASSFRERVAGQAREIIKWEGGDEKAIDTFETAESLEFGPTPQAAARFDRLRQAFKQNRERGYWQEEWNQAPTNGFYQRAGILAHLGAADGAFKLLNQAYQAHERIGPVQDWLTTLVFDEVWDPYRHDPRFKELLDKVGFTKVNPKLRECLVRAIRDARRSSPAAVAFRQNAAPDQGLRKRENREVNPVCR